MGPHPQQPVYRDLRRVGVEPRPGQPHRDAGGGGAGDTGPTHAAHRPLRAAPHDPGSLRPTAAGTQRAGGVDPWAVAHLMSVGGVGIPPMRALFETLPIGDRRLTRLYRASRPRGLKNKLRSEPPTTLATSSMHTRPRGRRR